MTGPFRILVVSVGNDCRSPLAERHLRHKFDLVLGDAADTVDVSSAGVRALEGAPMDALAADGPDPCRRFRAYQRSCVCGDRLPLPADT